MGAKHDNRMTAVTTLRSMMRKETQPPSVRCPLTMKGIAAEQGLVENGKDTGTCREKNGVSN